MSRKAQDIIDELNDLLIELDGTQEVDVKISTMYGTQKPTVSIMVNQTEIKDHRIVIESKEQ